MINQLTKPQDSTGVATPAIDRLRKRLRGSVAVPGERHYDKGRAAWNLSIVQFPVVAVVALGEDDIVAAVNFARDQQLGIAVQSTGHGITVPANGGMLIQTGHMRDVHVDPARRIATVEPGAIWGDVLPRAQNVGLAPLSGTSSGVGVVGYTLGGGSGWLGRKYGYAADHVVAARVVTADGRVLCVNAREHPELFWAIRGGTSNFGIVTEMQFRLFPDSVVYGGGLYWPISRANEVANVYREFTAQAPESVTSRLTLIHVPPLPHIAKNLHHEWLVAVQGVLSGTEAEGKELYAPLRRLGGVLEDTLGTMPMSAADLVARDPLDPVPSTVHTDLLDEISPDLVRYLVEQVARPDSPLMFVEMRHQGGAFGRPPETPNAVGVRAQGFWFNAIATTTSPFGCGGTQALSALRSALTTWANGRVFLNGIEEFGADRVPSAYGEETWRRLSRLKCSYDPENLFRLNRNIPPATT